MEEEARRRQSGTPPWLLMMLLLLFLLEGAGRVIAADSEELMCLSHLPLDVARPNFHQEISTRSNLTQALYDQGMVLAFAFNHDEALRSFSQALEEDPSCVMCLVGMALCYSPNINRILTEEALEKAKAAVRRAKRIAKSVQLQPVEAAWVDAISLRFPLERHVSNGSKPLVYDTSYYQRLEEMTLQFPENVNILTAAAEAAMDTMPWSYYTYEYPRTDGSGSTRKAVAKPLTKRVIFYLTSALELDPTHPLGLHLYIHIMEPSSTPQEASMVADRLSHLSARLGEGLGHLIHMPGHLFLRLGRYHDASLANTEAIESDRRYFALCGINTQDLSNYNWYYRALYFTHKHAFLIFSASMEGHKALSLKAAQELETECNIHTVAQELGGSFLDYTTWELMVHLRFGAWEEILRRTRSSSTFTFPYTQAMQHYLRGYAYASLGKCGAAMVESQAFHVMAQNASMRATPVFLITAGQALDVAGHLLYARLAQYHCIDFNNMEPSSTHVRQDTSSSLSSSSSLALLEMSKAVDLVDHFPYMEPPFWMVNPRSCLGQLYLQQSRWTEAETVFTRDLEEWPENGWSLKGLELALEGQGGREEEVRHVRRRFEEAWRFSDVPDLDRACF